MNRHPVLSGIDRIDLSDAQLKDRQVGLMTNPTGIDHQLTSTIDIINSSYDLSALFAVEHGERWHVGAVTGVVYGLVAKRFGLMSAIVAHVVTNLALGLFVICFDRWQFW